jgi:rRNA-processing protein EBP2
MAKKSAPSTGARIASKDKKATVTKSKKPQKPVEPTAEKLFDENEDEWEDESDGEVTKTGSKKAKKAKKAALGLAEDDDESSDESEGGHGFDLDLARLDESDSDSEMEDADDNKDESESEDDEEEEIDVDDLSIGNSSDEEEIAATTRVRETINNKDALLAALKRIQLDTSSSVPFAYHQSVISATPTADTITSIDDDLARELAFMNQSLEAARRARILLRKEGVPFTRPTDYFAETVRSDETMDKVKAKLIEEASAKKASAEARKQRDLKKFGKQVQVAKQQERAKQKRETLEKISELKKSMLAPTPSAGQLLTPRRAQRRRLLRSRRHRSRRPLRRSCRERAKIRQQQETLLQRWRSCPQRQASEKRLQIWIWRQEEAPQVQRRYQLRRHWWVQRQADEERWWRRAEEGLQGAQAGQGKAEGGEEVNLSLVWGLGVMGFVNIVGFARRKRIPRHFAGFVLTYSELY